MGSQTAIKNIGIGVVAVIIIGAAYLFLVKDNKQESPLLTQGGSSSGVDTGTGGATIQTEDIPEGSEARDITVVLNQLNAVSIDGTLFEDPAFRALTDFHLEVSPEPKGRQNPFLPGEGVKTVSSLGGSAVPAKSTSIVIPLGKN